MLRHSSKLLHHPNPNASSIQNLRHPTNTKSHRQSDTPFPRSINTLTPLSSLHRNRTNIQQTNRAQLLHKPCSSSNIIQQIIRNFMKLLYLQSLLFVAFAVSSANASRLLPLTSTELWPSDRLLIDPFRVLEHLQFPFSMNKDDQFSISGAKVDWKETPDVHLIIIDVPGMKKDELKIEVDLKNKMLKVSGERKKEEEETNEDQWHRIERSYGKFMRQFRMPENVDLDSVKAKLDDGVLKVTVKKIAPEKIQNPVKIVSIEEQRNEDGGGLIKEASDHQNGGSKQEL